MHPLPSSDESVGWRDELTARVAKAYGSVYLIMAPVLLATTHGFATRLTMVAVCMVCGGCAFVPSVYGRPSGAARVWLLVGPGVLAALSGFALLGFLSGPAVVLTLTLVTGGLLLGRRGLFVLCAMALAGMSSIAALIIHGILPTPDPSNVAFTNPSTWGRTILVTSAAIFVLSTLVVNIVARLERSLARVRAEVALREQAERARANAEIAVNEAKQLETIGRLAAGVAHDFNNSLTAIIGCAELLRSKPADDASVAELADAIIESSERAAALTRELLAYSRKAQVVLKPVDLHQLVSGALTLLRASLPSGITVDLDLAATGSVTRADASALHSAIVNLLVNARDAMPEGGKLSISTRDHDVANTSDSFGQTLAKGRYVLLEVSDSGTGIDAETLPKIFEPFFTTKPVGKGTGLGLAAVAGTVRMHSGVIAVETTVGLGTTFRILLPREESASPDVSAEPGIVRGTGHVLLVDDDPAVRRSAEAALKMLGYQVTTATDGEHALEVLARQQAKFDLMILDLNMPRLDGPQTFERTRRFSPQLPILVWSGYGAEREVEQLLRRGAVGFVQKPYSVVDLSRTLAQLLTSTTRRPKLASVEHMHE